MPVAQKMPKGHKRMGYVRIGKSKKMEGYYEFFKYLVTHF